MKASYGRKTRFTNLVIYYYSVHLLEDTQSIPLFHHIPGFRDALVEGVLGALPVKLGVMIARDDLHPIASG